MAEKSEPILGVDDLLGRFSAVGQTESSGSFTLDPKKALERLAQFQLPGHYHWILKVIQCLHLSGAKKIKIDAGVHKVQLTADVVPQGFDGIDDLLTQLLADADVAKPALRHLAAGLQGCLAVKPSLIRLDMESDREKRTYVLKSGGWRDGERSPASDGREHFELNLVRNLSEKLGHSWFLLNTDIFDLLFGRRGALDKENKVVYSACDYGQCDIWLGNRLVNSCKFGHPRFKGYDIRNDPDPSKARPSTLSNLFSDSDLVDKVAHAQHHLVEWVIPSDESGGFRLDDVCDATVTNRADTDILEARTKNGLSRAYGIKMDLAPLARIEFWEDGVLIGRDNRALDCPGLFALVDARGLRKDLTTLQVLDDDRFKELLEEIREAGKVLRKRLKENLHLMPVQQKLKSVLHL